MIITILFQMGNMYGEYGLSMRLYIAQKMSVEESSVPSFLFLELIIFIAFIKFLWVKKKGKKESHLLCLWACSEKLTKYQLTVF